MSVEVPLTFLDLCQRLRQECGISGTGPSAVLNQVGEMQRIVSWIQTAWLDIQTAHQDWDYFRTTITWPLDGVKTSWKLADIETASGVSGFAARFGRWNRDSFRNYQTSVGLISEIFMDWMPYDKWRDLYFIGAMRSSFTRPNVISIMPDKSIVTGPVGASGYTMLGDYYTSPQSLSGDSATPCGNNTGTGNTIWPTQYNMMIVYRAMMSYGTFENAPEVYNHGEKEFNKMIRRIVEDRLPDIQGGGAMA